jgi:PAS domain S-box-containing protein
MPTVNRTQGKQSSDRTTTAPEVPVSESSPRAEERLRGEPALTHTAGTTARFIGTSLVRYLAAVAAVVLALLVRAALARYGRLPPYNTFYPFILLVALLGGIWAGLLATGLSALAALYWLLPPRGHFAISSNPHKIGLAIFCTTGTCVSIVAGLFRRQHERLAERTSQLEAANAALRDSEERLRLLGDNLPNSLVYQCTYEPDDTPRFLYISAGVERLNGVKTEDVLRDATVLYRQVLPEELPALLEAEKISARELSVFEREVRMQLPDGQLRWMHLLSRPRRLVDGRVIWDGVQTDITERKRAEQALLRSEKLASLGRMAATIAHEINNPLDAVMNLLFLANSTRDLPDSARHLLGTADAELRRVAHITQQSLGFYREFSAPTLTSVNAVLDSAVDLQKSKIKAKHAVIDKRWDADVQITAIAGELRQVFSNLVSNSLDAIDERGTVKLRVSAGNHRVRITVADNGRGIPLSVRQHIFEPFFTTKDTVGTGLGLWVTQQIVEKHGGAIQVRSHSDGLRRGTTFSVLFPVGPTPAAQSQSVVA